MDHGVTFTSASALIRVDAVVGPGLRHLVVEEFSATIPSFVHSKTAPNATEANVYNLRKEYVSDGTININTGALTRLRLFVEMTNAYYLSTAPALVQLEITGTLDPANGNAALTLNGAAYEE